jgi:hypothetical protein
MSNSTEQSSMPFTLPREGESNVVVDVDGPKPNETEIRTGIPALTSFEQIEKVESLNYRQVNEGEYDFLDRAVRKGVTLLSNSEMDVYFDTLFNSVDNGHRFAITFNDGKTKYYRFTYIEPPLSLENHYVHVLLYAPEDRITHEMALRAKPLPAEDESYLSVAIAKPYRWTGIDEGSAKSLQVLMAEQGNIFTVSNGQGTDTIQLGYLGAFSEELEMPEFQSMYDVTATNA